MSRRWTTLSRSAIVFACAASLLVVGVQPVSATNPGAEGRIAYVTGGALHVVNSDGTNNQDITPACHDANEPHWAPDGSLISYIQRCGPTGTWDIATIAPDGTGFTSIIATAEDDGGASFSPDGSQIAYYSYVDGDSDIYVAHPDGTQRTNLTINTARDVWPTWSPDGSHIAFASDREGGGFEIYSMAANGSDVAQLTSGGGNWPSWSPDGSRILFTRGDALLWMRADGSGEHMFAAAGQPFGFPEWSPDSTQIAVVSGGMVTVMNADGTGRTTLAAGTQPAWEPSAGIGDPSVWFTTPDAVGIGSQVTLTGSLNIPGDSASGKLLHVYATPPAGSKSEIGTTATDGAGDFDFSTTPSVAGDWTYEVARAADATHVAAKFSGHVEIGLHAATMTLHAPDTAVPYNKIVLHGTLAITDESSASREVKIFRTPPGGQAHLLGTTTTDGTGAFKFATEPESTGDWGYKATWAGTDTIAAASASVSVKVSKIHTQLSLKISRDEVTYGQRVKAVVNVDRVPNQAQVTIVAVYGGRYHKVAHGRVVGGRYHTSLRPEQRLNYFATFDGDKQHASSQSNVVYMGVRVDVSVHMANYSSMAGKDAVYKYTDQCLAVHRGCPTVLGTVKPTQNLPKLVFVVQFRKIGTNQWRDLFTFRAKVFNKNRIGMLVIYQTEAIRKFEHRVRVEAPASSEFDPTQTPWRYFRVS